MRVWCLVQGEQRTRSEVRHQTQKEVDGGLRPKRRTTYRFQIHTRFKKHTHTHAVVTQQAEGWTLLEDTRTFTSHRLTRCSR